jgi:hypothetical protein
MLRLTFTNYAVAARDIAVEDIKAAVRAVRGKSGVMKRQSAFDPCPYDKCVSDCVAGYSNCWGENCLDVPYELICPIACGEACGLP